MWMTDIYIYIYAVIWYENDTRYEKCYGICDKLTCLWYDILWCDMLWYDMYMKKNVMSGSMECYDMI